MRIYGKLTSYCVNNIKSETIRKLVQNTKGGCSNRTEKNLKQLTRQV